MFLSHRPAPCRGRLPWPGLALAFALTLSPGAALPAHAQSTPTLTSIYAFNDGADGASPRAALALAGLTRGVGAQVPAAPTPPTIKPRVSTRGTQASLYEIASSLTRAR